MVVADFASVAPSQNPETTMTECVNDRHDVEARNGGENRRRRRGVVGFELQSSHCACLFVQPLSARIRRFPPPSRALHSHFPFGLLFRSGKMAARKRKVLQRGKKEKRESGAFHLSGRTRERSLPKGRKGRKKRDADVERGEERQKGKEEEREGKQPAAASTATTRGKIDEMRLRRARQRRRQRRRHSWGFPF